MDAACITYEGISLEQDIFPRTKEPVWILGKEYITDKGKDYFSFFDDLMKTFDIFATTQLCRGNFFISISLILLLSMC